MFLHWSGEKSFQYHVEGGFRAVLTIASIRY